MMNDQLKQEINRLQSEIETLRPLDQDTEGRIQQKFRLDWNYHSNNIEGNSLTFGETKSFLLHGITAAGKPLKDHLDIKGHNDAVLMLEDVLKDNRPLNETFIRGLHEIILNEPYGKPAITPERKPTSRRISVGQYKSQPNHVITKTGETFYFAKPEETAAMMNDLMVWYNSAIDSKQFHPVELAALLHYKFIRIHPFDDGNGRISRILMNLTLMKYGFPPVIIKTQKKEDYYRALQQADGGDIGFFVDYIAQLEIDSLHLYLKGAKGEGIEEDDDIDKEIALFKAKHTTNLSNNLAERSELIIQRFDDSFIELLRLLNEKISSLDELFSSTYCYLTIHNTSHSHSSFENNLARFYEQCRTDKNLKSVTITWGFLNLITSQKSQIIDIKVRFDFYTDQYRISIESIKDTPIQKALSQHISDSERSEFVGDAVRFLMNKIDSTKE